MISFTFWAHYHDLVGGWMDLIVGLDVVMNRKPFSHVRLDHYLVIQPISCSDNVL
jgi:hypothetical protein